MQPVYLNAIFFATLEAAQDFNFLCWFSESSIGAFDCSAIIMSWILQDQ